MLELGPSVGLYARVCEKYSDDLSVSVSWSGVRLSPLRASLAMPTFRPLEEPRDSQPVRDLPRALPCR